MDKILISGFLDSILLTYYSEMPSQTLSEVIIIRFHMSQNSSPKTSSHGSAAELIRVVELLIDSDEEEKNLKKITALRAQFPVLKKIHSFMTNQDKLQIFMRDPLFKTRIMEKLMEKGIYMPNGVPIMKVYLISTRYGASVPEQFDENDLLALFQRFGPLTNFYCSSQVSFATFQQMNQAYLAVKALNELHVSESVRLCTKWCSEDEGVQAQSLFASSAVGIMGRNYPSASIAQQVPQSFQKHIAKFIFEAEILPEFNIAQRIIGPRGKYLKSIIDKIVDQQPFQVKQNLLNVDSLIKIRLMGRGSGFQESFNREAQEKMHLFVSSRNKNVQQIACFELEKLMVKVFQEYKIHYQKIMKKHVIGTAYRLYQHEGEFFMEVKHVDFENIDTKIDFLNLEKQEKLPESMIEAKIKDRERLRKMGKYQEADEIRDWLKERGVKLIDSKLKGKKSSWSYEY